VKKLAIVLLLMCWPLSAAVACPSENNVSRYFPAEAGLVWDYAGEGIEFAEFTRRVEFVQGTRVQMSEYNGATRTMLVFQVAPDTVIKTFSQDEVYDNTNFLQKLPNRSTLVLKAPLVVGAMWEDAKERREILSTTAKIAVPAGSFDSVVVVKITSQMKEKSDTSHRIEYYAANTGLIMREFLGMNDIRMASRLKFFGRK